MRNNLILFFVIALSALCVGAASEYQCRLIIEKAGKVLQVSPQKEIVEGVGVVDYYETVGGLVTLEWHKENLRVDQLYDATVLCSNGSASTSTQFQFTPHEGNMLGVADRFLFLRDNIGFLLGGGLLMVFIVLGVRFWFRFSLPIIR